MNRPELLAPAGSLEKLKMAVTYGADAVYAGMQEFSLRSASKNFSLEQLKEGLDYAHTRGKRVYVAVNIILHNQDLEQLPHFLEQLAACAPDALIIADMGAFMMAQEFAKNIPLHISTQACNVNWRTVQAWRDMGAKRVVLARELSLEEIGEIHRRVPDVELEAFVHGAMCVSYSGRCLLSNYMAARDGNHGECAHPCRWKYYVMEEKRPGQYMPVHEDEQGTFIYNSKDLNMIGHIPALIQSGLSSFKIEGRVKSEFYVATVTKAYRRAIDRYLENPDSWQPEQAELEELLKVSNRRYTTGFYLGKPDEQAQVYESSSYIRTYDVVGLVKGYNPQTGESMVEQRNRFFQGDVLEIVPPDGGYQCLTVGAMKNEEGESITVAPHPKMAVYMDLGGKYPERTMLRRAKTEAEQV